MASFDNQVPISAPVLTFPPPNSRQNLLSMGSDVALEVPFFIPHSFEMNTASSQSKSLLPQQFAGRKRPRDEVSGNTNTFDDRISAEGATTMTEANAFHMESPLCSAWREEKQSHQILDYEASEGKFVFSKGVKTPRVQQTEVSAPSMATPTVFKSSVLGASTQQDGKGPIIDDFTVHLGIGWRGISDNEHVQAAARGWARYIENHYPMTNARVCLESKSLESYLVETTEGFFLFSEDLHQARLVSPSVEGAMRNLQLSPPIFDGAHTLTAAESPSTEQLLGDCKMGMA